MPKKFAHGSSAIQDGKLRGTTDTDYFYFFCPKCEDDQIVRVLDYRIVKEEMINPYDLGMKSKSEKGFVLQFQLHCEKCEHSDTVKISNLGWQVGNLSKMDRK
ncbi:hypothetical protein [Methylomonas koyamae]|uniref:hypothetical protein n=1 Tax=Methylomonas koyamae TaxID=702114 RepID=UPI002873C6FC|nr:hypothetical protein [Methylomonas koyamae]WNB77334.1 hypothetical protein RI210_07090 [Methylomonas koyamae]